MAASASVAAGSSVVLTTTGTAIAYGTSAAFSALASQAAISLANNQGDIGATLKELGSEETIKNLAVAAISGGATAGITSGLNVTNSVATSAINASTSATVQSIVTGADFEDALVSQLKFAAASIAHSGASSVIGDAFSGPGVLNNLGQAAAHIVAGCAAGSVANGSCAGGAAGAVTAEFAAEFAHNKLGYSIEDAAQIGKYSAAFSGLLADDGVRGITAANMTGTTAVENNYLTHTHENTWDEQVKTDCAGKGNGCLIEKAKQFDNADQMAKKIGYLGNANVPGCDELCHQMVSDLNKLPVEVAITRLLGVVDTLDALMNRGTLGVDPNTGEMVFYDAKTGKSLTGAALEASLVAVGMTAKLPVSGGANISAADDFVDASTPTGRRGNPMEVTPGTNTPTTINNRNYSGHALDQMQGRGVPSSVVEDAIQNGVARPGNIPNTTEYISSTNGVSVVVNSSGRVVTVITKKGP